MSIKQRGDTMVEVMVAFVIFAMAATAAIAIMNQGLAIAQRSLEITLVRQQVDSQADMLRYVRDNEPATWGDITTRASGAGAVGVSANAPENCPTSAGELPAGSFFIQPSSTSTNLISLEGGGAAAFSSAATYAQVSDDSAESYGLWIQPVRVDPTTYDMYINTCWDTIGGEVPQSVRTIVRLYED